MLCVCLQSSPVEFTCVTMAIPMPYDHHLRRMYRLLADWALLCCYGYHHIKDVFSGTDISIYSAATCCIYLCILAEQCHCATPESVTAVRFTLRKCCHGNSSAVSLISLNSQSATETIALYCYLLQRPGCAQQLANVHRSCRAQIAILDVLVATDTAKDLSITLWVEIVDGREIEWGRGTGNLLLCPLM